jgi:hypothetical protein
MGLPSDFPLTDNAFGMAQDVLALFDSEELSHARAERGRLFYEASASAQVYDFKWEHLLRSTGVDVASSPAPIGRSKEDRRVSRTSTHVAGDAVAAKPARGEANKELGAVLTLERVYAFETDPSLSIGLGAGWYPAEHTGVWCGANGGAFTAVLRSGDPALEIESVSWVEATIKCRVFGSLARGPNEVNVSNDQKIVATWRFENDSLREMKVVLPITAGEAFPIARFVMRPLHAWSPAELGIGEDRRKLGLLLVGMTFRATDPPPADATAIGSVEG